jgi:hypothetical protein
MFVEIRRSDTASYFKSYSSKFWKVGVVKCWGRHGIDLEIGLLQTLLLLLQKNSLFQN